ncbi:Taurine catabolism dioxygenase TauD/TfdA [Macrophomina phaseolina MS6]|uniref:Taurine catabolism dioxygenase TauD/TfdA n=1 Tax=Macrophomina phaseolina (strain MS6) TaxID=1126212 RepID=K2SIM3_MACPH|nr:Taurine catabolism dioxygenase TauD/TfdA [Macrophomina phaseolina MS6]
MSVHAVAASKRSTAQIAEDVLSIIESYRLKASPFDPKIIPQARETFLPIIQRAVEKNTPISLTLPAFPFKSPNTEDKVLGLLPDKAEEVSLKHLQAFCDNIKDTYAPGAELTIVSDGIVYSDLLGVPDATVWEYGERLRQMALELDCNSVHFARLSMMPALKDKLPNDLLNYHDTASYEQVAPLVRDQLVSTYSDRDYDVSKDIATDESVKATYMGYLKYLSRDLRKSREPSGEASDSSAASSYSGSSDSDASSGSRKAFKRKVSKVSKQMIARGKCYAACVQDSFPDSVRLSIHAANSATKIPISVIPNAQDRPITPWHSVMTCRLDGSFVPMTRREVNEATDLEPVYKNGQLWCYREKSDLYNNFPAAFIDHMYPMGLMITFPKDTPFSAADMKTTRKLSEHNSPVILRGLAGTNDRPAFLAKGREMGEIMKWKFGELLEVKDGGDDTRGLNNVLSSEPMPFHYDGLFKMVNGVSTPPRFQMFTAATASPKGTGHTMFATSPLLFKHLIGGYTVDDLRKHKWFVETQSFDNSRFGNLPLVVNHPTTGVPCIRYHEDWPQERTRFEPTRIHIEDVDEAEDERIRTVLEKALYDRRVCLYQGWEKGDILVNDNILTMHTREGYTSKFGRELWRLHID